MLKIKFEVKSLSFGRLCVRTVSIRLLWKGKVSLMITARAAGNLVGGGAVWKCKTTNREFTLQEQKRLELYKWPNTEEPFGRKATATSRANETSQATLEKEPQIEYRLGEESCWDFKTDSVQNKSWQNHNWKIESHGNSRRQSRQ